MRRFTISTVALGLAVLTAAPEVSAEGKVAPVPIEEAAAAPTLTPVPIDLSPDGQWLAYTAEDPTAHPPINEGGHEFTATGVPMSWGGGKSELWVANTTTGESINLKTKGAMSWGGVWSPDGSRLAFYSDRRGQVNLWIWERSTGRIRQLSEAIARPFFWFELPRWSPDGRRVLCKVLPEGMTLAQAAARLPTSGPRVAIKDWAKPSFFVLSSPTEKRPQETGSQSEPEVVASAFTNSALGDLALIDVETAAVTRIVQGAKPRWFSFSPDGKMVAFTTLLGWEANSQQPVYELGVYFEAEHRTRILVRRIRQGFGISVSWSPDGKELGYVTAGHRAAGDCFIVPVAGGEARKCSEGDHPSFADDFRAPLWDPAGKTLYFIGGFAIWKTDLATGKTAEVAKIPGRRITGIVGPVSGGRFWSPDGGRSMVVTSHDDVGKQAGFYKIDVTTGKVEKLLEETKHYGWSSSFDVSDDGRHVVWQAEDAAHPSDFWIAGADFQDIRRVTHVAPVFDQYEMGKTRLVDWLSVGGQKLRGTLLLPAGYREGERYPLVVFVYGGGFGSNDVNRFGLWGAYATFNMQVLATRGYAVLSPDAPLRVGTPLRDLADTVLPGVNRVVEMGIADPDRLAVMGQSYGSYSVLALLGQTTRFKAAVITAVVESDLLAGYLYMNNDGTDGTGYFEEGQGGMGGTPWQHPARYYDNSPVYLFDKVETPLLMAHGTMDSLPIWWPDATFVALRRLGKRVQYAMYAGEGHVISGYANTIDFWNRRLAFLEANLKPQRSKTDP
jgi:dipeptidyl aminopeptidase/acylaminoacyl peptidase